jgi:hypothetical protein
MPSVVIRAPADHHAPGALRELARADPVTAPSNSAAPRPIPIASAARCWPLFGVHAHIT